MTYRDAYRLRRATPDGRGGRLLEPLGDGRIFNTWKDALVEARKLSAAGQEIVTQAVMVDESGAVVFPPDDMVQRSRGKWAVAPVIRFGPRAKNDRPDTSDRGKP